MKRLQLTGGLQLIDDSICVKFKRLSPEAIVPTFSRVGDAGADLVATSVTETDLYIEYGTSLAIALPDGTAGLIFPRSSLSNYHLALSNSVGVLDQNYRGEIKFRFKKTNNGPSASYYKVGDRIGQLIVLPIPAITFEEVEELDETNRGESGYGSSGV